MSEAEKPLVDIIMGSDSDLEVMTECSVMLTRLGIRHRIAVISAHRTPDWIPLYTAQAEADGIQYIIAAAGGSAALPGDVACQTPLPVIGVPMDSEAYKGLDALYSMQQLPKGVPVAVMPIGKSGAINAAYFVARLLGVHDPAMRETIRSKQIAVKRDVREMNANMQVSGLAEHIPLKWLNDEQKS